MRISISLKLTLWYSVVLFSTLMLYAFLIYFFISRQHYQQQNNLLNETAEEILQYVKRDGDKLNIKYLANEVAKQNLNRYGIFFEIFNENRDVKFRSTNFPSFTTKVEQLSEKKEQVLLEDNYGITFQLFISPIKYLSAHKKESPYYLLVGQSTLYVTNTLTQIRKLLFLFGTGMLVIAGMGGWYLVLRALRPVSEITKTARSLSAYHLDKRLPENGNEDELGQLMHTFNEMIGRIQSGVIRIQQFSSDAAHELRTPLTILQGEIEIDLLRKDPEKNLKIC